MAKKKRKLKWKHNEALFAETWTANAFVIEFIEGYGGEDGGDAYSLSYRTKQIEYFRTLKGAQRVAQLIHNG